MPYIKSEDRSRIDSKIAGAQDVTDLGFFCANSGDLNYLISHIVKSYYNYHGGRYQEINDIVGALEGAKLEFTRRVTNDYEDKKAKENGDVY